MAFKAAWVREVVEVLRPRTVWDLGANTGAFSHIASETAEFVLAADIDPACVERNYQAGKKAGQSRILPLLMDLSNPSPALGWAHQERDSLLGRGPSDLVLALALIHHLAISNNTPFPQIAEFLRRAGNQLIIEFVPLDDPRSQSLLGAGRSQDVFDWYTRDEFERAFGQWFTVKRSDSIPDTERVLYLMEGTG